MNELFEENKAIQISRQPNWYSDELWQTLQDVVGTGKGLVKITFSREERKIFRKRKPIPISKWAEKHREGRQGAVIHPEALQD